MKQLRAVEIDKMRQLADFLETVPPEDFDLEMWRTRAPRDAIKIGPITLLKSCGFAGCAMGWAAYRRLFEGLYVNRHDHIVYKGATEFKAAAKLFGITMRTAYFLFHEQSYDLDHADPHDVAQRVRRFASIVECAVNRKTKVKLRAVA